MSIAIKSGAKVLYQWERGVALTASTPCDILRVSREDDRVTDDLYPVINKSTGTAVIPDRMMTESGYLHISRIDLADGSERVLETVRILIRHAAKPQNTASSTKEIGDMQALKMQMAALERAAREGKFDGKDGITPHVGENGNWFAGDVDLGVRAKGDKGDKGDPGDTPHIGENGNWFAGDVDLGVRAKGDKGDKGDPGDTPHIGENGNWFVGDLDTGVRAKSADVSLYADDLYTSGVLVTDDMESFVMTGKTSDTGTPQLITSPGVVYIKGIRRRFAKSTRTFHVPDKERVSVQYIRLNEITGEIEQQNWEDVIIDGDIHNGGTITGIETGILPRRSGGYYDVILCIVTLPAGATEVTPDMIRDLRGDERYCGFVRSKVDGGAKALTEHNVSENAHNDIRLLLSGLTERLNAIADSDDTTLDQLSEIVAYIKANKTLIESVTTSKVNVADIVDNLTTNVSDQPLSAKMGVELRRLISVVENRANNAMSDAADAMNRASYAESMASSATQRASSAEQVASAAEQMASAAQAEIEKLKENGVPGGGAGTSVEEIHIGADEPTDGEKLWIDPNDEGDGLTAEDVKNALGYTPANAEAVGELSEAIDGKQPKGDYALKLEIPTTLPASDVSAWAKQPDKPTYTASEVGALPDTTKIPAATSDLKNDSGYITIAVATLLNYYLKTETYAKTETYSQTEVDNLISGLDKRLNAIADSEDVDLDQLSEIVAYIKANKSLIDSITTSKVNVSDIVDNLTTADSKKPLSAAQGKALKAMYDALPAWAKEANKPTYSKSEVGLGNVDNVQQYSASNPPPYPVTSVNGQTGAVTVTADGIGAATTGQVKELTEAIADKVSKTGITLGLHSDGKYYIFVDGTPVGTGLELSGNSGDVFGYVDENNNIVLNGNLADGSYSIKYEMEDDAGNIKTIDIGDLVLDSNVYYTVTNNLTNCTNSNSDTQAISGQAYTATITADSGYELSSVTVTMGGTDVSASAVSGGVITIAEVTGNIVITASATETTVEITNWIDEVGYSENTRLSLSSGNTTTASGYECTGFIPAKHKDVIRIKNIDLTNESATNIVGYDSSKQPIEGRGTSLYNAFITNGTEENGVYTTTLSGTISNAFSNGAGLTYIRIGSKSITADSIVTINQEIV